VHSVASGAISSINSLINTPEIFATLITAAITGLIALLVRIFSTRRRLGYSVIYDEAINQDDPLAERGPAHRVTGGYKDPAQHMWEIIYEYANPADGERLELAIAPTAATEGEQLSHANGEESAGPEVAGQHDGCLKLVQHRVPRGSLVVMELRNVGLLPIRESDFEDREFTLRFPGRKVVHYKIRENEIYHDRVQPGLGALPIMKDSFKLPAALMNRGDHFKVLVLLEGQPLRRGNAMQPFVQGSIEGGKIRPFNPRPNRWRWIALITSVMLIVGIIIGVRLANRALVPAPNCASGKLMLEGSTAFAPIMNQVATEYEQSCSGAQITVSAVGSGQGLSALERDPGPAVAMYDGDPPELPGPQYESQPVGDIIFDIVANRSLPKNIFETGPGQGLSRQAIAQAYSDPRVGSYAPVGRLADSGTRQTFVKKVLAGYDSQDSAEAHPGSCRVAMSVCLESTTMDLLNYVNSTPNAIGYAEADALTFFPDVGAIPINGYAPTRENALNGDYTFVATEYLYTKGAPGKLASDLISFLTSTPVSDQLRDTAFIPCAELRNSKLGRDCQPAG
jgi:ABC-type phosphate transport system substrate-binding protein